MIIRTARTNAFHIDRFKNHFKNGYMLTILVPRQIGEVTTSYVSLKYVHVLA